MQTLSRRLIHLAATHIPGATRTDTGGRENSVPALSPAPRSTSIIPGVHLPRTISVPDSA
eukprot:488581-Rhodomonas_salina.1